MIQIGKLNTLTILRETAVGLHLGDEDKNEVLLPNSYKKSAYKVKDKIEVFIYKDSEDRLIATPQVPYAQIYSFSFLRVTSISEIGAFLDWGLEKDLFMPHREQLNNMEEGESYVVYIYLDELTQRIIASALIDNFISNEHLLVEKGDEVSLMVFEESPLGYSCIIDGKHRGLLYRNDIYKNIQIGDEMTGYIKNIRQDNLIDLSLQKPGFQNVLSSTDVILEYLAHNDGYLNLTDKSTPEEIAKQFAMSKATFKKSIGVLYRHRKVVIKDDGVYLAEKGDEDTDETEKDPENK
ncbi:MAG: GntR family transcriptional regulator [Bacteroidetes bacterium]|nr:GntR family transcriptional regulator [Bacteroidota bacterium]